MKRPLTIWCLVAASLVGVVAWADLVLVLKGGSLTQPVVAMPDAEMLVATSAISFTPTVSNGATGITWTASGLPTGASINSETGAVTGTLNSAGLSTPKITATNAGGSYDIWLPIIVYSGTVQEVDQTWYNSNGGSLTGTNKLYRLTGNISATGTGFALAADCYLDMGGYTLTYDTATPPTLTNGSFESGTGTAPDNWNLTSATSCTRIGPSLSFITRQRAWTGDYSLQCAFPHSGAQTITNSSTIALTSGVKYALTAHWLGNGLTQFTSDRYLRLTDGTNTYDTQTYAGNAQNVSMLLKSVFTAGATDDYTLTAHIADGTGETGNAYLDDIRITFFDIHGVSLGDRTAVVNGAITQSGNTYQSHACHIQFADDFIIHGITGTTVGNGACFAANYTEGESTGGGTGVYIGNCTINSNATMIGNRSAFEGYAIYADDGLVVHNTINASPQGGVAMVTPTATTRVAYNSFTIQSRYTNGFAVFTNGTGHTTTEIDHNTVDNSGANDGSRGIMVTFSGATTGITVHDNTITTNELTINSEYAGSVLNGCYGIQLESADDVEVYDNTITVNGYTDGTYAASASGIRNTGDSADIVNIHDNTITVSTNDSGEDAACFDMYDDSASVSTYSGNSLSTNGFFFRLRDGAWGGGTFSGHTFTATGTDEYPFDQDINGRADAALTISSPTYADTATQNFIENDLNWRTNGTIDATSVAPVVE